MTPHLHSQSFRCSVITTLLHHVTVNIEMSGRIDTAHLIVPYKIHRLTVCLLCSQLTNSKQHCMTKNLFTLHYPDSCVSPSRTRPSDLRPHLCNIINAHAATSILQTIQNCTSFTVLLSSERSLANYVPQFSISISKCFRTPIFPRLHYLSQNTYYKICISGFWAVLAEQSRLPIPFTTPINAISFQITS